MTASDVAVLLLRLTVGITMVVHGYNHLWGGGGLAGTARWFGSLGMRPPKLHALLSGVGEVAAGLALALGAVTPLAAAFVIGTMTVAGITAHRRNGFFVFRDGYEYVLVLAMTSTAIALLGPGRIAVDRLFGIERDLAGGTGLLIAAGAGVAGALVLLAATWRPARA